MRNASKLLNALGKHGVTIDQSRAFVAICKNPGKPASSLHKRLGTSQDVMRAHFRRLERRGLIRREKSSNNGRSIVLPCLTAAGRRLQAQLEKIG